MLFKQLVKITTFTLSEVIFLIPSPIAQGYMQI